VPKPKPPKNHAGPKSKKRPIEQYAHPDKKRVNNPPVGLVTPLTDPPTPTHRTYEHHPPVPSVRTGKQLDYDPHLDPQLVWAGKKEHTSFEVPTVSLHVHERIDPRTIIEAVRRRNGNGRPVQGYLFESREENPPLREAIDFYRHAHGWSNRLIAGDSLLVMNSLLEKEGMAGQVQMIYIDPPYGIRYGSNFQPFVNRRDVKDGKDEDLTQEPEMVRAFRDTWELGIHSYLTYLRDRLLLARELLHESGSCFVQISNENIHLVRNLMDEVFEADNFCSLVSFRKTAGANSPLAKVNVLGSVADYLIWYARDLEKVKYRQLYRPRELGDEGSAAYQLVQLANGERRRMAKDEIRNPTKLPTGARAFRLDNLTAGGFSDELSKPYTFEARAFSLSGNLHWKTTRSGMDQLATLGRIAVVGNSLAYVRYIDDFPVAPIQSIWTDTATGGFGDEKIYVVQTVEKVIQRCVLMTTDPGDLVFDPTCGSGTTAQVSEEWGRRWVTCDTSRVAITLAKQRLMSAQYKYYELAHAQEGVGSGLKYETVPHVTLKSLANNEPPKNEVLYDRPLIDNSRARISGPFTVEAVPAPNVKSIDDLEAEPKSLADFRHAATPLFDASIARSGPTLRQSDWRDELLKTGIRGKGGQMINFSRVEPLGGTRWLHADAETKGAKPERVVISFGPDFAPLTNVQVETAWQEARTLIPRPDIIVFAAFQFDPEAAKEIDDFTKEKTGMTFLTAQMNVDLLTDDLKKKRSSNQSFWLVGRPDVEVRRAVGAGLQPGSPQSYIAEVRGFDYYNTRTGSIESGDTTKIAMWLLDTDYDGRSLYPRQVFFPLADADEGWAKLARNLKAEIDLERIEAYRGTISLPFELGEHKRVAVKVIDDRGIESLKVVQL
jgi:adenine-specific DNA-methyltransferase